MYSAAQLFFSEMQKYFAAQEPGTEGLYSEQEPLQSLTLCASP